MAGTLLVVGSAPCLFDDVARALELRPFAALMLVNGACTAIERVEHVLAGHTDKAEAFAIARRQKFPNAPPWRLHATTDHKQAQGHKLSLPSVTDWHGKEMVTGAGAIGKGAAIGLKALGFDEVIICGAPMDGSGYFKGEAQVPQGNIVRIGSPDAQKHRVVDGPAGYRAKYKRFAETWRGKVFSMSGWTRECSGEPTP